MDCQTRLNKTLCLSIDIRLDPDQRTHLIESVQKVFNHRDSTEVPVVSLSWREYVRVRSEWETVVVFFAGYNLERYGPNLIKHLLLFPR